MKNKDLIVIGSYPNTEKGVEILKSCIKSLKDDFDILLSTHYPADKDIQLLVDYYIYDIRNEFVKDRGQYFWADYESFYSEIYSDNTYTHHSFAVYRQIINAVNFSKDIYDSFFYLEGDCYFDKTDIKKLKELKETTKIKNKKGCFFCFHEFLCSTLFYCNTEFFLSVFPMTKTIEEYEYILDKIQSYGALENFLYRNIISLEKENEILSLENIHITDYFENSEFGLSFVSDGKTEFSGGFVFRVAKIDGTEELALLYVNNNSTKNKEILEVSMDGRLIANFPNEHFASAIRIYPDNDDFMLSIGNLSYKYNKKKVLENKSFVKFK